MFGPVLVVCVGNICRSPIAERMLGARLPGLEIGSAGLAAVVGHGADENSATVAQEIGISLEGHIARQLTAQLGAACGLILAMEPGHRAEIIRRFPQLSGRVMLFDQWNGGKGIPDPYRKPIAYHREIRDRIAAAADGWVARLSR